MAAIPAAAPGEPLEPARSCSVIILPAGNWLVSDQCLQIGAVDAWRRPQSPRRNIRTGTGTRHRSMRIHPLSARRGHASRHVASGQDRPDWPKHRRLVPHVPAFASEPSQTYPLRRKPFDQGATSRRDPPADLARSAYNPIAEGGPLSRKARLSRSHDPGILSDGRRQMKSCRQFCYPSGAGMMVMIEVRGRHRRARA